MTYLFNRQKLLQKARKNRHNCGGKEKAGECYLQNKKFIKENTKKSTKTCQKKKKQKESIAEIGIKTWKGKLKIFLHIKKWVKTQKYDEVEVNKKEFHVSKKPIPLNLVDTDEIVVSDRFKGSEYFTGYLDDDIIRPLCVI